MDNPIISALAQGGNTTSASMRDANQALSGATQTIGQMTQTSDSIVNIANQKVSLDMKMYQLMLQNEDQKFNQLMKVQQFGLEQWKAMKNAQLQYLNIQTNEKLGMQRNQIALMQTQNQLKLGMAGLQVKEQLGQAQLGLEEQRNQLLAKKSLLDSKIADAKISELNSMTGYNIARTKEEYAKTTLLNNSANIINLTGSKNKNLFGNNFLNIGNRKIAFDSTNPNSVLKTINLLDNSNLPQQAKTAYKNQVMFQVLKTANFNLDAISKNRNTKPLLAQLGSNKQQQQTTVANIFLNSLVNANPKLKGIVATTSTVDNNSTKPFLLSTTELFKQLNKNQGTKQLSYYFLTRQQQILKSQYQQGKLDTNSYNTLNSALNKMQKMMKFNDNLSNARTFDDIKKIVPFASNDGSSQSAVLQKTFNLNGGGITSKEPIEVTQKMLREVGVNDVNVSDIGSAIKTVVTGSNNNFISKAFASFGNAYDEWFGPTDVSGKTQYDKLKQLTPTQTTNIYLKSVIQLYNNKKLNPLFKQYNIKPTDIIANQKSIINGFGNNQFFRKDTKFVQHIYDKLDGNQQDRTQMTNKIALFIAKAYPLYMKEKQKDKSLTMYKFISENYINGKSPYNNNILNSILQYANEHKMSYDDIKGMLNYDYNINDIRNYLIKVLGIASVNESAINTNKLFQQ